MLSDFASFPLGHIRFAHRTQLLRGLCGPSLFFQPVLCGPSFRVRVRQPQRIHHTGHRDSVKVDYPLFEYANCTCCVQFVLRHSACLQ